jgi:transcriptional regulator with XRE-family HTH domain
MQKQEPHFVDIHVGSQLRIKRLAMGVSQADLALQAGVTFQQIQKYEKGTNRLSASKMFILAKRLGVEPSYFFEGLENQGDDEQHAFIKSFLENPDGIEICRHFEQIKSKKIRNGLAAFVKTLSEGE